MLFLGTAIAASVLSFGGTWEWANRSLPCYCASTTLPQPYSLEGYVLVVSIRWGCLTITQTRPIDEWPALVQATGVWLEQRTRTYRKLGSFIYTSADVHCRIMPSALDLLTRPDVRKQLRTLGVRFERRDLVCPLWALAVLCCVYPVVYLLKGPVRRWATVRDAATT